MRTTSPWIILFIRQFSLGIPMLHKFTSATNWYGAIVPLVLMRDQRPPINLFIPACPVPLFFYARGEELRR